MNRLDYIRLDLVYMRFILDLDVDLDQIQIQIRLGQMRLDLIRLHQVILDQIQIGFDEMR